jgi:hypothetical protein
LALIAEAKSSADAVQIGEVMMKGEKSQCRGKSKKGGRFKKVLSNGKLLFQRNTVIFQLNTRQHHYSITINQQH